MVASAVADLDLVASTAQRHQERVALAGTLADEHQQMLPKLYANERQAVEVKMPCGGRGGQPCAGPAVVRVEVQNYKMSMDIRARISQNRQRATDLAAVRTVPEGLVPAVLRLQRLCDALLSLPPLTAEYDFAHTLLHAYLIAIDSNLAHTCSLLIMQDACYRV